jgi:hypothetical protein
MIHAKPSGMRRPQIGELQPEVSSVLLLLLLLPQATGDEQEDDH